MCIGNQKIKNHMHGQKSYCSSRDIKQRAENPYAFKANNAVKSNESGYRANKEGNEYV